MGPIRVSHKQHSGAIGVPVLGHMLKHMPSHVPGTQVPIHMAGYVPIYVPDRHMPENMLKHVPQSSKWHRLFR